MTHRKREIIGLRNERDFPHLVELALPPEGFRSVLLEIDAFHRERRIPVRRAALTRLYLLLKKKPLLASQEENEWPREDHTNPFAQPERTGIVRVHQKSQDQPGAKVEPSRRTTAPDRRAQA
jgi:hypothetical protein